MQPSATTTLQRTAVIDAVRTPFMRRATELRDLPAVDLGALCVAELLARTEVDPGAVERVVFGRVVPNGDDPNIARQVTLQCGMSPRVDAYSVSRACTTSYQCVADAAAAIATGEVTCAVAGGADSASHALLAFPAKLSSVLQQARAANELRAQAAALGRLALDDLVPHTPAIADAFSGMRMGDAAEQMAKRFGIGRAEQDRYAERSHRLAAAAFDDGRLEHEVMTLYVPPEYRVAIGRDNTLRPESQEEHYAALPPVFDERFGTVTAGTSSPLTDGAAAVLLMAPERAQAEGLPVLGYVTGHAFVAVDPQQDMLMGPAYVIPALLERCGMELSDVDLVDLHEAFAAQVLAVEKALGSDQFAHEHLNRSQRVGELDWDKTNVSGGSIAFGHPFAATGARQLGQTLRELKRRGGQRALCAACAAGGLGAAIMLEVAS